MADVHGTFSYILDCEFERPVFVTYNGLELLELGSNQLIGQIKRSRVSDYLESGAVT
jgi:hypothetical protein